MGFALILILFSMLILQPMLTIVLPQLWYLGFYSRSWHSFNYVVYGIGSSIAELPQYALFMRYDLGWTQFDKKEGDELHTRLLENQNTMENSHHC